MLSLDIEGRRRNPEYDTITHLVLRTFGVHLLPIGYLIVRSTLRTVGGLVSFE